MNHRVGRGLFALGVGLAVAVLAFQWITDPAPRAQREAEERAVLAARALLVESIGDTDMEIVDALAPDRRVGKVYVYAEAPGWAVSGHYRRGAGGRWHPYLMHLTADLDLHALKADDPELDLN
ncbi:MAG: hypothetical protein OEZ11_15410 [Gammaproteobacteria bacterium]|nr:hypothetical protein [Gammaproteobacteria bacterium]